MLRLLVVVESVDAVEKLLVVVESVDAVEKLLVVVVDEVEVCPGSPRRSSTLHFLIVPF